jgi:hypothetical protein
MKHHQTRVEGRGSRAGQAKRYEPVREFERATSYCPLYLAWRILDEARDYFRTPIPEAFADKLARRAEAVFAHHPFMQRQFKSASGRAAILMFMRHWLAGVLARERPALFRDLPESFKVGHPLPQKMVGSYRRDDRADRTSQRDVPTKLMSRTSHPVSCYVHGCELLAVWTAFVAPDEIKLSA